MPQRDVLEARLRVGAQHARQAGHLLGFDRVALVRHRARALLPGGERLADLGDLGPREVAQLDRKALQASSRKRDRAQQLGVAVARDDLRRNLLARQAEPTEHAFLELGRGRGVRPDGAGDRADAHLRERALQAPRVAVGLERERASLMPNVVGSAWTPWVRPAHSVSRCARA